jgi:hypothetical protein
MASGAVTIDSSYTAEIAKAGRGTSEFVVPGERLETKVEVKLQHVDILQVIRQLKLSLQPSLEDASISWEGVDAVSVTQLPNPLPPVFNGNRLLVYGQLQSGSVPTSATLTGVSNSKQVCFKLLPEVSSTPRLIETLAARAAIRYPHNMTNVDQSQGP